MPPPIANRHSPIRNPHPVSLRSVLIGLALIPPNIVWVVLMERVEGRTFSTTISLFFTAVFSVLLLTGSNWVARRVAPRLVLRQGELLTIFSMLSLATAMAGVDLGSPLVTIMGHAFWFAGPENRWDELIWEHLPRWLTVSDEEALRGYYVGGSTLYSPVALRAWVRPAACWTALVAGLLWVMACLNTILRIQWTENEKLSFPIVQLPLAITAEDGGLFRSRLFWIGDAVPDGGARPCRRACVPRLVRQRGRIARRSRRGVLRHLLCHRRVRHQDAG